MPFHLDKCLGYLTKQMQKVRPYFCVRRTTNIQNMKAKSYLVLGLGYMALLVDCQSQATCCQTSFMKSIITQSRLLITGGNRLSVWLRSSMIWPTSSILVCNRPSTLPGSLKAGRSLCCHSRGKRSHSETSPRRERIAL